MVRFSSRFFLLSQEKEGRSEVLRFMDRVVLLEVMDFMKSKGIVDDYEHPGRKRMEQVLEAFPQDVRDFLLMNARRLFYARLCQQMVKSHLDDLPG